MFPRTTLQPWATRGTSLGRRRGGRRAFPIARTPRAIELRIGDPPRDQPILSSTSFRRAPPQASRSFNSYLCPPRNLHIPRFFFGYSRLILPADRRSARRSLSLLSSSHMPLEILLPSRRISLSLSLARLIFQSGNFSRRSRIGTKGRMGGRRIGVAAQSAASRNRESAPFTRVLSRPRRGCDPGES